MTNGIDPGAGARQQHEGASTNGAAAGAAASTGDGDPRAAASSGDVVFEVRGALGLITLNRPRALNALTHEMITDMQVALDAWATDDRIATVAIRGAGERGLCAGGDVTAVFQAFREGHGEAEAASFFLDEYRLDRATGRFPKPYVALMDGIVLGGGVGVSAHGSHRIVTERSRVGMPETGIGLFPDVGATWLLSHVPDGVGYLMALTGTPIGPGDAIRAGLADTFVPSERLEQLLERLETERADDAIAAVRAEAPAPELAIDTGCTRRLSEAPNVPAAIAVLEAEAASVAASEAVSNSASEASSSAARVAVETIATRSPTSLKVAFAAIRGAASLPDLESALVTEYRIVRRMTAAPEFAEGVRAQLIDKDRNPAWSPATLDEVDDDAIAALFAPHEGGDLTFAGPTE